MLEQADSSDCKEKIRPFLGRPGEILLGCVYDCPAEKIILNVKVKEKVNVKPLNEICTKLCSIEDIHSELDIDLDTRLKYELGILEVKGVDEYIMNGMNNRKYRSGIFFIHKCRTRTENIPKDLALKKLEEVQSLQSGTHIVTRVTYGCYVIFWTSDQETLKAICNGAETLDELRKRAMENQCKGEYFGHSLRGRQEGTFLDAVRHMKTVNPNVTATAIRIYLYPIQNLLEVEAENRFTEIGSDTISRVLEYFRDMQEVEDRFQQLQKRKCWEASKILSASIGSMGVYMEKKEEVLECLQNLIPDIHNGKSKEEELKTVLNTIDDSSYDKQTLNEWVDRKEKEADRLEEIDEKYEGIPCFRNHTELITKLDSGYWIFCLVIKVPKTEEINLQLKEGYDAEDRGQSHSELDNKLKIFDELWIKYKSSTNVKFFRVFVRGDMAMLSIVINLYKGKELLKKNFTPLAEPEQVLTREVTDTSIQIEWQCMLEETEEYKACIESPDDDPLYKTSVANSVVIENLIPEKVYRLRVCKVLGPIESEYSKYMEVTTEKTPVTSRPPKPTCCQDSPDSFTLQWTRPERVTQKIESYSIFDADEVEILTENGGVTHHRFPLLPNFKYQFAIQANCGDHGSSKRSEFSDPFEKRMSEDELRIEKILKSSNLISEEGQHPKVYQLQLNNAPHDNIVQQSEYGEPSEGIPKKVIMLLGATGSGKTMHVNGMANYILGMKWEDDFRIRLIPEEEKAANQAHSQTTMITAYTIHHQKGFRVPYTVTIIDTPGFGDTAGITRDQEIVSKIDKFFRVGNLLNHLDAVGFVAQSALPRLTPTQRYIFDSILSIFGKDIEENILPLLTFSDSQSPQALSALKEAKIPFSKYFKFNNSAVYADNTWKNSRFDQMFWEMGEQSFQEFFDGVTKVTPKSLQLTKEVLSERERLQLQVENIKEDVYHRLNKLDTLSAELKIMDEHKKEAAKNKDFKYTVFESFKDKEPILSGNNTTNCISCQKTCHYPCSRKSDKEKAKCKVMKKKVCTMCACPSGSHINSDHIYVPRRRTVEKTYNTLKKHYKVVQDNMQAHRLVVEGIKKDIAEIEIEIVKRSIDIIGCITRLREIALKPNPLSTEEYVKMLINAEKREAQPGWEERCKQLYEVQDTAILIEQLTTDGYDPFRDHTELLKKVREHKNRYKPDKSVPLYLKALKIQVYEEHKALHGKK